MSVVTDHLSARGVPFEVIRHEQAYTSVDEARALGIAVDEVLKSVGLATASGPALAVIPASQRLHMSTVRRSVGDKGARFLTEEELERDFPDFELGALPPLGSLVGAPTYVDPEVLSHETVVFAAGSQTESVKVRTQDLFGDEEIRVVALTRRTGGEDEP